MTELLMSLVDLIKGQEGSAFTQRVRSTIPYAAAAGEAALNPSSLLRNLSKPAKTDLLRALRLAAASGRKNTSAINMAYGKRRNSRFKRRSNSRAPFRKRVYGRRRKAPKKNNSMMSAIHKAMTHQMM